MELASITLDGQKTGLGASEPSISADGRYVAFWASAQSIVPGDHDAFSDVVVRDRWTSVSRRVSESSTGLSSDAYSKYPDMSDNGQWVTDTSSASNLVAGDTNGLPDQFVGRVLW